MHFWPERDTLRSRLLKHTLLLSSGAAASAVFAYLFRITCARTMPIEDYGRLALFLIIYSNLIILACFNLGISVTKYASEYKIKDKNKIPSLYLSASTIAIITSFLAFIVSMIVYGRYNILSLPITTCLFFSFFFIATHWVNMGILQGFQKMGWAGILQASLNLSKFVLLIIFAAMLHRLSIESALLAYFMGIYVTSTLSFFLILRILKVKWTPLRNALSVLKRRINRSTIKLIISFSGYTVLRDLLSTSLTALIPALILSRTNFADVAYLDITLMLYSVLTLFLSSLGTSLLSMTSEHEAKYNPLNYSKILHLLVLYSMGVIAVLYIIFYVRVDVLLIKLIFGEKFLPSASLLHILVFALPFQIYSVAVSSFLMGVGKPGPTLKIRILTFIIALPLYIVVLMVMQKGASGAAVVFVVTQMLGSIFSWHELRRNIYHKKAVHN